MTPEQWNVYEVDGQSIVRKRFVAGRGVVDAKVVVTLPGASRATLEARRNFMQHEYDRVRRIA